MRFSVATIEPVFLLKKDYHTSFYEWLNFKSKVGKITVEGRISFFFFGVEISPNFD
jgi:hypothetical protein